MAFQPNDDTAWLSLFRQHMDEMFNYIFRMREQGHQRHGFSPSMDIYETSEHFVIELDLPGFSEGDFTISALGSTLRIEGVKRQEKTDSAVSFICLERHFGRFFRSVEIPGSYDPARTAATYERGVLTIKAAKR